MILDVLIAGILAGRLDLARPNAPVFTYDPDYVASTWATPLSTLTVWGVGVLDARRA